MDDRRLLAAARRLYDASPRLRRAAAAAGPSFRDGARFLAIALAVVRRTPRRRPPPGADALGVAKYAAATAVGCAAACGAAAVFAPYADGGSAGATFAVLGSAGAAFVAAFYLAEAPTAYLFPAFVDGAPRPFRVAAALLRADGGPLRTARRMAVFGAAMLGGGFGGRGFRRAWCVGALAVVLRYETLRRRAARRRGTLKRRRVSARTPAGGSPVRILFASDLHLGPPWSRRGAADLVRAVRRLRPDAVLLGGDLADGGYGVAAVRRLVAALARRAPVYAVPGNHDVRAGLERVRAAVSAGGGRWLPDGDALLPRAHGKPLRLAGPLGPRFDADHADHADRTDGSDGVAAPLGAAAGVEPPGASIEDALPVVVCAHHPEDAVAAGRRPDTIVAFAGHLHGGQWAWFRRGTRLFPGAWFWPSNGLGFRRRGFRAVFSLGAGDTLPLRLGCPRDFVCCDVDRFAFSEPSAGLTSASSPAAPVPRSIVPPRLSAHAAGAGSRP